MYYLQECDRKQSLNNQMTFSLGNRKIEDLTETDFDFQGFLIPHITLRKGFADIGFKEYKENNRFLY